MKTKSPLVIVYILLCFISFGSYFNSISNGYALDDAIVITENAYTQEGIEGIANIFKYDTFRGFFGVEGKSNLVSGGRYRPLSLMVFAIEKEIFGNSPMVGHLTNMIFFTLSVLLLFVVFKDLFISNPKGAWIAFFSAFLFAVHPIHTEVVANIKGLDEILAVFFGLLSLFLSLQSIDKESWKGLLGAGVCLFLALLAKEVALAFLFIIPLGIFLFRGRDLKLTTRHGVVLSLFMVLYLTIRFSIVPWGGVEESMEFMNNPFLVWNGTQFESLSFFQRVPTILYTLILYVKLLFFPYPLTHDYYPKHIELMDVSSLWVWMSLLIYMGMVILFFQKIKKDPIISLSIFIFLSGLFLVSNLLFPVGTFMSERFLYLPSLGFCLLFGLMITRWFRLPDELFSSLKSLIKVNGRLSLVLVLLILILGGMCIHRNRAWKNNLTLFTTDIKTSSNSAKLCNAVGGEIIENYKGASSSVRNPKMQEAIGHLDRAISIHPLYYNAYLLRGNAMFYMENYEEAIRQFEFILEKNPSYEEASQNLFLSYLKVGRDYGEKRGNLSESLSYLSKAEAMNRPDYELYRLLGVAYGIKGDAQRAISYFEKARDLKPQEAGAYYNLAAAYYSAGRMDESEAAKEKMLSLDPEYLTKKQ